MVAERVFGVKLRLEELEQKKYTCKRVLRESVIHEDNRRVRRNPIFQLKEQMFSLDASHNHPLLQQKLKGNARWWQNIFCGA